MICLVGEYLGTSGVVSTFLRRGACCQLDALVRGRAVSSFLRGSFDAWLQERVAFECLKDLA